MSRINKREASPLSSLLKKARIQAGFSQREVAEVLGYGTPQFVSNWERGVATPPVPALKRLQRLYRLKMTEVYRLTLKETLKRVEDDLRRKFAE